MVLKFGLMVNGLRLKGGDMYRLILDEEDFKVYMNTDNVSYIAVEENYIYNIKPTFRVIYDVNNDNVCVDLANADYMGEEVCDECIIYWGFDKC